MDKSDLIVAALKEQIGDLSFINAVLRAEVTILTDKLAALNSSIEEQSRAQAIQTYTNELDK